MIFSYKDEMSDLTISKIYHKLKKSDNALSRNQKNMVLVGKGRVEKMMDKLTVLRSRYGWRAPPEDPRSLSLTVSPLGVVMAVCIDEQTA